MKISVTCMHLLDLDLHQHKEINHKKESKVLSRKYCIYIPFFTVISYKSCLSSIFVASFALIIYSMPNMILTVPNTKRRLPFYIHRRCLTHYT
jgi:hypothetical protein